MKFTGSAIGQHRLSATYFNVSGGSLTWLDDGTVSINIEVNGWLDQDDFDSRDPPIYTDSRVLDGIRIPELEKSIIDILSASKLPDDSNKYGDVVVIPVKADGGIDAVDAVVDLTP